MDLIIEYVYFIPGHRVFFFLFLGGILSGENIRSFYHFRGPSEHKASKNMRRRLTIPGEISRKREFTCPTLDVYLRQSPEIILKRMNDICFLCEIYRNFCPRNSVFYEYKRAKKKRIVLLFHLRK